MTLALRKYRAIFAIYFQEGLAYRASGLIWIVTDLVTALTMPLVWAKASAISSGPIAGFAQSDFILYYLCLLLLGSFVTSHIMWDLAMEIKEGNFSVMLVRPVGFFRYMFLRNLAWRIIRTSLFAPMFLALLVLYSGFLGHAHVYLGWQFWCSLVLGHLVSFSFVIMFSMFALFVQEVYSIFELYYVPMLFLSGQLFPIAVLPGWAQGLAKDLPFYYTTGAPTEILIGRVQGPMAVHSLAMQVFWVVFCLCCGKLLWRYGLKHYTGVGM